MIIFAGDLGWALRQRSLRAAHTFLVLYLLLVSLLWAFSFGLIKRLTGLDGSFISATRLGIALLVFFPFLRWRALPLRAAGTLAGIGAVQFGLMYLAYNESFRFLKSYEIALFTLTTPIFVTLLADAFDRTFRGRSLWAAAFAVVGGACIVFKTATVAATLRGVLLVQLSNLAFAAGQVIYRRTRVRPELAAKRDREIFGLLYLGAFAVALPATLVRTRFADLPLTATNLGILLYLGVVASGLGFFLWNRGAVRVSAGTLAVMNNVKVPLAVLCSVLVFHESAPLLPVFLGGMMMLFGVWIAEGWTRV